MVRRWCHYQCARDGDERQGQQMKALFSGSQPLGEAWTEYANQLKPKQCLKAGQDHPALFEQIGGGVSKRELFGRFGCHSIARVESRLPVKGRDIKAHGSLTSLAPAEVQHVVKAPVRPPSYTLAISAVRRVVLR